MKKRKVANLEVRAHSAGQHSREGQLIFTST